LTTPIHDGKLANVLQRWARRAADGAGFRHSLLGVLVALLVVGPAYAHQMGIVETFATIQKQGMAFGNCPPPSVMIARNGQACAVRYAKALERSWLTVSIQLAMTKPGTCKAQFKALRDASTAAATAAIQYAVARPPADPTTDDKKRARVLTAFLPAIRGYGTLRKCLHI
jgi:hypothetical protein